MKSEIITLAGEFVALRTHVCSGQNVDESLHAKCTQLAIEHENSLSRLRESDRQLASARREQSEMEAYIRNTDMKTAFTWLR